MSEGHLATGLLTLHTAAARLHEEDDTLSMRAPRFLLEFELAEAPLNYGVKQLSNPVC